MSDRIAVEFGVATSTLRNLVTSESQWNPKSDNGFDRGLVQINRKYNPEITDKQAFDPEFSLRFAAEKISKGEAWKWTVCSCIKTAKVLGANISGDAKDIIPNTNYPHVGGVVKFKYSNNYHVAYINKVTALGIEVTEGNFKPCLIANRFISWSDPHIVGFWTDFVHNPIAEAL